MARLLGLVCWHVRAILLARACVAAGDSSASRGGDPRWWWGTALAAPPIVPDVGAVTRHACGPRMDASCVPPECVFAGKQRHRHKRSFLDAPWPYFPRDCREGGANFTSVIPPSEAESRSAHHVRMQNTSGLKVARRIFFDGLGHYGYMILHHARSQLEPGAIRVALPDANSRYFQGHTRVLQLYFNWSFWRSNVSEKAYTLRELEER